jgi:hypothetical protein
MVKVWIFWVGADEEPDGNGGVMALVNGAAFGSELGEKGTERCGRGRRIAEFMAEIEIEPGPFLVVRTLGMRDPGLVEPALETSD